MLVNSTKEQLFIKLNSRAISDEDERAWISLGAEGFQYLTASISSERNTDRQVANALLLITKIRGFDEKNEFANALRTGLLHSSQIVRTVAANVLTSLFRQGPQIKKKYEHLIGDLALAAKRGLDTSTAQVAQTILENDDRAS